tara:strand:+ start:270 stop:1397 length:1128 start_codon:yes stop_codon:yes gene_type:complete
MRTLYRVIAFLIGASALLLYGKEINAQTIGDVILQEGNAVIEQSGEENISVEGLDVFSYDVVKTGNGKTAISFIDDTRVDVTEHSKLIIDEFVYDPANNKGSLSIKASLGTIRYASGQIAKKYAQNVNIETPTATIGVRGTDFSMTVDEIGGSTIILLPSCDTRGYCYVGEIEVETDAGFVIMNQAFQATVVTTGESKPMKPVILDLDENMIGNLLIIQKPQEIVAEQQRAEYNEVANALDIDFLEFNDLEVDELEIDNDTWSTGLDIDFLEQNFLVDVLAQINKELAKAMRSEFVKQEEAAIDGVQLGKDPETGIIILDEDPEWVYAREGAATYFELRLDKEYGYVISFIQEDFEVYDYELGGQGNEIRIYQSN